MNIFKHQPFLKASRFALLYAILCVFSSTAFGKPVIPPSVENSFKLAFPNALSSSWQKPLNGIYTVSFKLDKIACSATFDSIGKLVEKRASITKAELPQAIFQYLNRQHEGFKLIAAYEVYSATTNSLQYFIKLKDGKEKVDLLLSKDGYLLGK